MFAISALLPLLLLGLCISISQGISFPPPTLIKSNFDTTTPHWNDTSGNRIEAHAAGLLQDNGIWYWYGESKKTTDLTQHGVNCYTSSQGMSGPWEFVGQVLAQKDIVGPSLHSVTPPYVVERPKVLYNNSTNTYVMWFHLDDAGYKFRHSGVATSSSPSGPFTFAHALQPDNIPSLDMNLWMDPLDNQAYLIRSCDNQYAGISALTSDYMNTTGVISKHDRFEGMALFRLKNGTVYLISSHLTGWTPNPLMLFRNDGPSMKSAAWTLLGNPTGDTTSFNSQPTFVVSLEDSNGEEYFVYLSDNWIRDGGLINAGYIWLPFWFHEDGSVRLKKQVAWDIENPFQTNNQKSVACHTDEDCSLLGICDSKKECICDPGWKGTNCGIANLRPLNISEGYHQNKAASWGGRPIYNPSDQKWHLFVTEIQQQCPLILFMNNSAVIRAESASPEGPYIRQNVVLPPFHHNPQIIGPTPDGYYLLLTIGQTKPDLALQIQCDHQVPEKCTLRQNQYCRGTHMPYSNGHINLAYSQSLKGPWTEKVILPYNASGNIKDWNCENNNPTATILSNGTVVLVYRADACSTSTGGGAGGGEALGIATATHWNGTYRRRDTPIVSPQNKTGNHEDPFLWQDRRGYYHIITHNQATGNVCNDSTIKSCGAHLYSKDTWLWKVGKEPVYDSKATLVNGTEILFKTRQRPQLVLNKDDLRPEYLFNGGSFDGGNNDCNDFTHTFVSGFVGGGGDSGTNEKEV